MMRNCIVFTLLAVSLTAATGYQYEYSYKTYTADVDFLHKQKKVFDLLAYVDQNIITDTEYYEYGHTFELANHIEYFTNQDAVSEFLEYWKSGDYLSRDALFSYYNDEHLYEMKLLYQVFYFAKDFTTFYKAACWARTYMNPGVFLAAFTNAVTYRSDTKYIRLPLIYEILPSMFFDSKVIRDAYKYKMSHCYNKYYKDSYDMENAVETYYVYSNYSDYYNYYGAAYNNEYKLSYFTGDISLNAYYYYFRMAFPFWMDLKSYDLPKSFRGDFYYYIHKQIMSRYYLERSCNGFNELDYFSWDKINLPGYYSDYTYANGIPMPKRDWWNFVPYYKAKSVEYIKLLETRIYEAIDFGFFYNESGKPVDLYTQEGLNYLGNLIEGNYDSENLQYYGSYDALARNILSMNYESTSKNYYIPSAMQFFSTSLKDPAFYRLYDKIVYFFQRYKNYLERYSKEELDFPDVSIEDVEVDKLVTYFDVKDYYINNAITVNSYKEGKSFNMKAWQYFLSYKPYTYKFSVNSKKETKGIVRIFLGPAYEGEQYVDYYSYFSKYYKYFFELDQFEIGLKPGMNTFDRKSTDSPFFYNYNSLGSDAYYKKIMKAIEGNEPFTYGETRYGFPSNLMLPKGSVDGMKYKMFFYISPYQEGKVYDIPFYGQFKFYGQSFGFPLDRPMNPWFFKLQNMYFKDVSIIIR
ncbi:arylphorin subunit alpha-like [Copidosoma floridanum]|uniref:arylphorin subunit alpha-like n=1 Tax=Copidosoma floridanum TaxID=29053 RepID=UPI0006C94EEF|nr:arylphorin subunit alpha-like [Copidosoma floridanum]